MIETGPSETAADAPAPPLRPESGGGRPCTIVVGNEKGGVGKTTLAMHLAAALAVQGHRVATLDADGRQGSLSRYLAHRHARARRSDAPLAEPAPQLRIEPEAGDAADRVADAQRQAAGCTYLIVDTPGAFDPASQAAHAAADLLVTPVGDSFLDLDALAEIDVQRRVAAAPSAYTKAVWTQNNRRIADGRAPAQWLVVRNRMSPLNARSKRDAAELLQLLAARIGFTTVAGISERLVFRELFYAGLTVADLPGRGALTPSRRKAAQEIGEVVAAVARAAGAASAGADLSA